VLAIHLRDDGLLGGCEEYRMQIPFKEMREHIEHGVFDFAPLAQVREWAKGKLGYISQPTDYDMWVLPRHRPLPYGAEGVPDIRMIPTALKQGMSRMGIEIGESGTYLMDMLKLIKLRCRIVMEYDDDHWGARDLGYLEYVDYAQEMLKLADAITVTTRHLRDRIQEFAAGVPVYVLPNCVKFADWQGKERWNSWPEDAIVLGLTGSPTHGEDWKVLEDVLPRVLREYGEVCLMIRGFVPYYLEDMAQDFPGRVDADKYWLPYAKYPEAVRQADIVLCPVVPDDLFNLYKSSIKAVEAMASGRMLSNGKMGGAAVIASPLPYYRRTVGHNRGIVAEHTPDDWYRAITALVTDKERRETYQVNGRKWVREAHAIERQWPLWWNAYVEINSRRRR